MDGGHIHYYCVRVCVSQCKCLTRNAVKKNAPASQVWPSAFHGLSRDALHVRVPPSRKNVPLKGIHKHTEERQRIHCCCSFPSVMLCVRLLSQHKSTYQTFYTARTRTGIEKIRINTRNHNTIANGYRCIILAHQPDPTSGGASCVCVCSTACRLHVTPAHALYSWRTLRVLLSRAAKLPTFCR